MQTALKLVYSLGIVRERQNGYGGSPALLEFQSLSDMVCLFGNDPDGRSRKRLRKTLELWSSAHVEFRQWHCPDLPRQASQVRKSFGPIVTTWEIADNRQVKVQVNPDLVAATALRNGYYVRIPIPFPNGQEATFLSYLWLENFVGSEVRRNRSPNTKAKAGKRTLKNAANALGIRAAKPRELRYRIRDRLNRINAHNASVGSPIQYDAEFPDANGVVFVGRRIASTTTPQRVVCGTV